MKTIRHFIGVTTVILLLTFSGFGNDLVLENQTITQNQDFVSTETITAQNNFVINSPSTVTFIAKNQINLKPGFHAKAGSVFTAKADDTDSDNDGLIDIWENHYFGAITLWDGDDDPDTDGLTNSEEFNRTTNPNNPDSDGDGLADGWEVDNGIDPLFANVSTKYTYDDRDRLKEADYGPIMKVTFGYDDANNLKDLTVEEGQ